MRIVVYAIILVISSGCISGPKEPVVEFCSIFSPDAADCEVQGSGKVVTRSTSEMLGYQCVSPKDFAEANAHHEILHREIDKKNIKKLEEDSE